MREGVFWNTVEKIDGESADIGIRGRYIAMC